MKQIVQCLTCLVTGVLGTLLLLGPAPALPPCEVQARTTQTVEPPLAAPPAKPEGPVSDTIAAVREGIAFGRDVQADVRAGWHDVAAAFSKLFWLAIAFILRPLLTALASHLTRRP